MSEVFQEDRDRVFHDYLKYVPAAAAHIHRKLPWLPLEDLCSVGALALLQACAHYDPDRKSTFAAYVKQRIRGAMLDSISPPAEENQNDPADSAPNPEQEALFREVWDAVARLPEQERRVIEGRYFRGETQKAVASLMRISQARASQLQHRALEQLRKACAA